MFPRESLPGIHLGFVKLTRHDTPKARCDACFYGLSQAFRGITMGWRC